MSKQVLMKGVFYVDPDRRLFRLLALMAEQGVGTRYESGEFRIYTEEFAYGVTTRLEIRLRQDGSHVYLLDGHTVERGHFLGAVRESSLDKVRAMDGALELLQQRTVGNDLLALVQAGWRFPDDGRVSFSWVRFPGGNKVAGVIYLDKKGHLAYELAGAPADRAEVLSWSGRPESEFTHLESLLLQLTDEG